MSPAGSALKDRAARGLADAFMRRAVRFATDRFRLQRRNAFAELPEPEAMRERGRALRAHVIAHLDHYLAQLAERVRAAGGQVFFAADGAEAVRYVAVLARSRGVKTVVKSKSMVSEELHLNQALAEVGAEAVETDLGEYIVQLAGQAPSHIIAPALHMSRQQVAELFSSQAGEPMPSDTPTLTRYARGVLRNEFVRADMGITGCNFAIAETGTLCIVTNEGNGRLVSSQPRIQVTLMGMERILPTLDDLDLMLNLLTRSATGQRSSVYVSMMTGPRREGEGDGPDELHLVIVDNMRSSLLGTEYQEALHCIRCGACSNVCPVYRHVGGHAYGWVYSGPIGAVLTPLFKGVSEWGEVAHASSLCGACWEICPVKIPLHEMLVGIRRDQARQVRRPSLEALAFRLWRSVFTRPWAYRLAGRFGRLALAALAAGGRPTAGSRRVVRTAPGPLAAWTAARDLPLPPPRSFRDRWAALRAEPVEELGSRPPAAASPAGPTSARGERR